MTAPKKDNKDSTLSQVYNREIHGSEVKLCWWRSDPASWTQQIQVLKTDTPLALPPIRPLAARVIKGPRRKATKLEFRRAEAK